MFYFLNPPEGEKVYPFTLTDLRRLHPNVSWPVEIDAETAASFDCFQVTPADAPSAPGKKAERALPLLADGVWVEQWVLVDYSAEEIDAQWTAIRADRNSRLSACDWTQLPDAPVDAAIWAEYRQALRDITEQADPFNIAWPTEPGA